MTGPDPLPTVPDEPHGITVSAVLAADDHTLVFVEQCPDLEPEQVLKLIGYLVDSLHDVAQELHETIASRN